MPAAARLGDNGSGHGCFPATPIIAGSGDVSVNGKPAARKGDAILLHACPCPQVPHGIHGRSISAGSSNVSINGKPAARVGDAIDCGGSVAAGSGNVLIGDTPYKSPTHKCGEGAAMEQSPFLRIQPLAEAPPFDWASLPFVEEAFSSAAKDKQKVVEKKSKKIRKGTNYNHKIQSPSDGYNVISSFRKKAGLQPYSSTSGDTVAFIEINGKKFFGVNSQITKTSQVSQKALREKWMKEVEWVPPKKNKPKHLGQVQSLTHGESHSLIRAYERLGNQLPKELSMYVDRKTCNMCRGEMPALLKRLGVDKLNIYSGGSTKPIVLESIKL